MRPTYRRPGLRRILRQNLPRQGLRPSQLCRRRLFPRMRIMRRRQSRLWNQLLFRVLCLRFTRRRSRRQGRTRLRSRARRQRCFRRTRPAFRRQIPVLRPQPSQRFRQQGLLPTSRAKRHLRLRRNQHLCPLLGQPLLPPTRLLLPRPSLRQSRLQSPQQHQPWSRRCLVSPLL